MVPLAHSAVLKNYVNVTRQLELNAYHLLSDAGLSHSHLNDSKQRIPVEKAIHLLEQSARLSGCDVFGLYMAEQRELSDFGELSLLLSYQHNLRDALNTLQRYRNLLNNSLELYIEEVGNTVIIREEIVTMSSGYSRQSIELALGITHRLCAAILAHKWRPLSIHFTHNAPQDLSVHRRVFGCKLEFGSEFNGIVCTTNDLNTANPQANLAMANHAQRFLDILPNSAESSIIFDIRKSIYLLLPMGRATIEQVAITHGVNVRTLQRRLEAAHTSFSDILGYSMPSSFTRWFISQFGIAPMTWRNNNKALLE